MTFIVFLRVAESKTLICVVDREFSVVSIISRGLPWSMNWTYSASACTAISRTRVFAIAFFSVTSVAVLKLKIEAMRRRITYRSEGNVPLKEITYIIVIELDFVGDLEERHSGYS